MTPLNLYAVKVSVNGGRQVGAFFVAAVDRHQAKAAAEQWYADRSLQGPCRVLVRRAGDPRPVFVLGV